MAPRRRAGSCARPAGAPWSGSTIFQPSCGRAAAVATAITTLQEVQVERTGDLIDRGAPGQRFSLRHGAPADGPAGRRGGGATAGRAPSARALAGSDADRRSRRRLPPRVCACCGWATPACVRQGRVLQSSTAVCTERLRLARAFESSELEVALDWACRHVFYELNAC
jgi:hypothetical protein